jgi:hypothetical protein
MTNKYIGWQIFYGFLALNTWLIVNKPENSGDLLFGIILLYNYIMFLYYSYKETKCHQ